MGETMSLFIAGLILFFAVHSISIVNVGWRDAMVERLGTRTWRALYSVAALAGLEALDLRGNAVGDAGWELAAGAALAGLVLLIWGYGIARADPVILYSPPAWLFYANFILMLFVFPLFMASLLPGQIKTAVKHPVFASVKIWAFAHLLTNGALADVLLFGCFLAWAVVGRISMKHRRQRPTPGFPAGPANDLLAVVSGLLIYLLFVMVLHDWMTGVRVM